MRVSGWSSVVLFIVFTFMGQLLFPIGDEPDFRVRSFHVLYGLDIFTPYEFVRPLFNELEIYQICPVVSPPFSLWSRLDWGTCTQGIQSAVARTLVTIVITSPILCIVMFPNSSARIVNLVSANRGDVDETRRRIEVLSTSIVFPSMIYYLGLLSIEQWVLVIFTLMVSLNLSVFIIMIFAYYTFKLDLGNTVVFIVFVLISNVYSYLSRINRVRLLLAIGVISLLFVYESGIETLSLIGGLESQSVSLITNKSNEIYTSLYSSKDFIVNKYPVYLRPVITFMSFVFYTANNVKVVPIYITSIFLIVYIAKQLKTLYKNLHKKVISDPTILNIKAFNSLKWDLSQAALVIWLVLFFVFSAPTYANYKYYAFSFPVLTMLGTYVMSSRALFVVYACFSVIMFVTLALMRI